MRTTRPGSPFPCLLWTFCVAAVTIAPPALHAQSGPSLEGRRIRLGVPGHELDGREALLDEVREDAFLVRPVGGVDPVRIERLQVQRLEVWEGRHGNALRGMAIGAGTGIAAGLVIGMSAEDTGFLSSGDMARIGAMFFGAVGAAGGLMVGRRKAPNLGPRHPRGEISGDGSPR